MTESAPDIPVKSKSKTRPFILSVLCIALFVYSVTLSLIFLFSMVFNKWISNTLAIYFPERQIESGNIFFLSLVGFVLAGSSFIGTYLIWRLRRAGLYIFSIMSLLLLAFPFLFGFGNLYSLLIIGFMIVLLFAFYKRF